MISKIMSKLTIIYKYLLIKMIDVIYYLIYPPAYINIYRHISTYKFICRPGPA